MTPVPLADVIEEGRFGGKAVSLGHALRAGLPVPDGFGIEVDLVEKLASSKKGSASLAQAFEALEGPVAIRSSAVGEDAKDASFAGQHVSVMNLCSTAEVLDGIRQVWLSARTPSAMAYRKDAGISGPPLIAAVMQKMVFPDCAGVLFTRDPITGGNERVIESAWGLGEVIVAGLVVPDSFRIRRDGFILERCAGEKDLLLRTAAGGGTSEIPVQGDLVTALTLADDQLANINQLANLCEQYYGDGLDIEWAIESGKLYLLQCRPMTRG